jgi:hypothetical protein
LVFFNGVTGFECDAIELSRQWCRNDIAFAYAGLAIFFDHLLVGAARYFRDLNHYWFGRERPNEDADEGKAEKEGNKFIAQAHVIPLF